MSYFNLYRSTLFGLMTVLAMLGIAPLYFGQTAADVFWITAVCYFLFSVTCTFALRGRWGGPLAIFTDKGRPQLIGKVRPGR
ncbi:MAG: hypothetical protein CMO26_12075 [Thiotrichales bacterium]|nr:hypothetical protein [Thiotrichales bacterium]